MCPFVAICSTSLKIPGESGKNARRAFEKAPGPEYIRNDILQYLIEFFLEIFLAKIGHSVQIL